MDIYPLFQFWVVMVAGRINAYQQAIIEYKDAEIGCLREQLREATGRKKPRFTDAQRVRLAGLRPLLWLLLHLPKNHTAGRWLVMGVFSGPLDLG